jgi:hypothetical protein
LAQDVSAGGKANIDQDRVTPLTEPAQRQSLDQQRQDQFSDRPQVLEDQTARMPDEEGEAAAIPGRQDEPVTGDSLGQSDQFEGEQALEQGLPPIEDDQTAEIPGELGQEQDQEATGQYGIQRRDLLEPGETSPSVDRE